MTSVATRTRPAAKKAPAKKQSPDLRVVDRAKLRRSQRRRALVSLSIIGLVITLFAVALLYAQLVEGQQRIDGLRADIAAAEAQRATLERDIAIISAPDAIVSRATEMGMVRAADPQYLVAIRSIDEGTAGS